MSSYTTFTLESITARIADLDFEMQVPDQWVAPDLPPANDDFSDPTMFIPLLLRVAPTSPIVLAVAARPAYDDGTIHDWVPYIVNQQNMKITAMGEDKIGDLKIMTGTALQPETDIGPCMLRFAFFEDGGRFVSIFLTAPEKTASLVQDVWDAAMKSFKLARPKGQSAHPDLAAMAAASAAAPPAPVEEESPTPAESKSDTQSDGFVPEPNLPAWWNKARKLEFENKLKEAEAVIKEGVPHLAFAYATADLYRKRMIRLAEAGDTQGAAEAKEKAIDWIRSYAGFATSGGEGAALSLERDAFLKEIGA